MSIKYDSKRIPLSSIINLSTQDAILLIPDLQRPYVWTPSKVILLIDSIFRGWPFGSLLLWEIKPESYGENEGIPHRPFWHIVDRTDDNEHAVASPMGQPATYQMVLDGQQRIQSLILALGGDTWGFKLYDHDWANDLRERRMKNNIHWSKASLCIDLDSFRAELKAKYNKVRKIEIRNALDWVIIDSQKDLSNTYKPFNYEHPLRQSNTDTGRFIRLSRLWNLAQKDLSESDYRDILEPVLAAHSVREPGELLQPLAEFMKTIESIKNTSFVHVLQIESFSLTPQWGKDDYNDAIVNIFTRLNTAGRTLTSEEITLAWLKVGWNSHYTRGISAGTCVHDFKAKMNDMGFQIETDDVVRLISFFWAVEYRNGQFLEPKDFLNGTLVRSMADYISQRWLYLEEYFIQAADILRKRELVERQDAFNAVIVFLTWYYHAKKWLDDRDGLSVVGRDTLEKELAALTYSFADRWTFSSQWANVWSEAAVQNFNIFAKILNSKHVAGLATPLNSNILHAAIKDTINSLMDRVSDKAIDTINNMAVRRRYRVHEYYKALWVWHRLNEVRWNSSTIQLRIGTKRTTKHEVDHTIADGWWQKLIDSAISKKNEGFIGTEEERAKLAPDGFENENAAREFINRLGNCSLLDKSFNISKSAGTFWGFLKDVKEFKNAEYNRDQWEEALCFPREMTDPTDQPLSVLTERIMERDKQLKQEVVEFIRGQNQRRDI